MTWPPQGRMELHESGVVRRPSKLIQLKSTDTLEFSLKVRPPPPSVRSAADRGAVQTFKENDILAAPVWSDSAQGCDPAPSAAGAPALAERCGAPVTWASST